MTNLTLANQLTLLRMLLIPGFVLVLVVLSFNMLGDGLRDALDPKAGR